MDPMLGALKARRKGTGLLDEESPKMAADMKDEGKSDLKEMVMSMSPEDKMALLQMLQSDMKADPMAIQKGGQSPGEKMEIEMAMNEEGMDDDNESEDEIMESMISSADKTRAENGSKPRNLGERVKMNLASKLKSKGKV